jgi:dephospho-CoA kinase
LMGPGWTRVAVVAPVEVRVERAVARGDGRDDVRARIRHQPTDNEWIAWADHVVDNGMDRDATEAVVARIVEETTI